jgi:hypothetical protein
MIDQEDAYSNEHTCMGKGLMIGIVLGSLMWLAIITGIVYFAN